jgi:hypothetical protein
MAIPLPLPVAYASADSALFLGPARVIGVRGLAPEIELPDGTTTLARMALAFPYSFAVGDSLLVVGRGGDHYVIGVLESRGEVALRFQGNVRLHAVGGTLELAGDEGLSLRSPEIALQARRMRSIVESVVEKCGEFVQTVRDTLRVQAGERHEHVTGESQLQADRHSVLTKGIVTINGKEVHLG